MLIIEIMVIKEKKSSDSLHHLRADLLLSTDIPNGVGFVLPGLPGVVVVMINAVNGCCKK